MPEDDLSKGAAGSGASKDDDEGDGQNDVGASKTFTEEHVQDLIKKRVAGLNKKNAALEARLADLEGRTPHKKDEPAKKGEGDEALTSLQREIATLKAENARVSAEKEAAKIDSLKVKMAKGKFPAWFDPTWLPGKTEDEIQVSIDEKLAEMKAEAEGETVQRKRQGFGGPVPKGKGVKQTGDEYMNDLFLSKIGRGPAR